MHSRVMLAILLEVARLAAAAPANSFPPNFDPKQFDIQPNKGGNPQDDCGNGPISLDRGTWNSHNMDALVQQVWDSGNGNPKFDFHQAFASKYTDALQCPDSFSNCIGDPSACSALSGSSADKEQGWLGIKAILNVQGFFLQMEKVTSNAADGISGALVDFQKKFNPPAEPADKSWQRVLVGTIASGVGVAAAAFGAPAVAAAVGAAALSGTAQAAIGAAAATIGNLIASESLKDGTADQLSITQISDEWNVFKTGMLTQIDHAHSSVFSNGFYNGTAGARMVDYLNGGGFSGSSLVSAYEGGETGIQTLIEDLFASKLLEATWRAQGAFIIFIPNVVKDCAKWKTNAGNNGERRLCAPEGMYLLNAYAQGKGLYQPPGMDPTTVKSWSHYNIDIHDLIQSSASVYQGHGLGPSANMYDFLSVVNNFESAPGSVFKQQGMFTVPVCQLQSYNWKQSDQMGNKAPCDCLTAADQWGNKFIDNTTPDIQNWIKSACS